MSRSKRIYIFSQILAAFCFFGGLLSATAMPHSVTSISSPDGNTMVQFKLNNRHRLFYRMSSAGKIIVDWSLLGIATDGPVLDSLLSMPEIKRYRVNSSFPWPLGEEAVVEDKYTALQLSCRTSTGTFSIFVRLYNGSLAFRYACYQLPKGRASLLKEGTEINLSGRSKLYQYHEESIFRPIEIDSLTGASDLPSTLSNSGLGYLSIGEADNRNYTKCVLVRGRNPNSLAFQFYTDTLYKNNHAPIVQKDTILVFRDSLVTPWRTISFSKTAIGLHDFSRLSLKLVRPQSKYLPSGIIPGKVFRVPINTQEALDGVDFAAKMNFRYILIDAGWYGAEFRTISDPTKPLPDFDLPQIISRSKQKGIGVILYVNYVGLKAKLDTILPLYKKWGVSGIKFGFVDGGTQKGLSWLDTAMQKVNDFGFVLNVHDHYKPTGLSRRYPFVLSAEGIRGDENSPDAFHNTVLPFTRFLAGAADFTFCFPNKFNSFSKNVKVSKAQQLALTVIFFDPLQSIFWYGRSKDYLDDPDTEFFKYVPTVWDESTYLSGDIGKSIAVARRKGNTWFLGAASGLAAWQQKIRLGFLKKGVAYNATIYDDDGHGAIRKRILEVRYNHLLDINLGAAQGTAIVIRPSL